MLYADVITLNVTALGFVLHLPSYSSCKVEFLLLRFFGCAWAQVVGTSWVALGTAVTCWRSSVMQDALLGCYPLYTSAAGTWGSSLTCPQCCQLWECHGDEKREIYPDITPLDPALGFTVIAKVLCHCMLPLNPRLAIQRAVPCQESQGRLASANLSRNYVPTLLFSSSLWEPCGESFQRLGFLVALYILGLYGPTCWCPLPPGTAGSSRSPLWHRPLSLPLQRRGYRWAHGQHCPLWPSPRSSAARALFEKNT